MRFSKLAAGCSTIIAALLALVLSSNSFAQSPNNVRSSSDARVGNDAFFDAVAANDSAVVAKMIASNPKLLKAKNEDEWTALHVAAFNGYDRSAAALLAEPKFTGIEARDPDGERPLHLAASNGKTAVAKLLLDRNAAIDARNDEGETPILEAAENGKADIVRLLLDRGANANLRNDEGLSPIMVAARSGYLPVVEMLSDHGASTHEADTVRTSDLLGYTPLAFAVEAGKTPVVEYLLLHGAHPVGRTANGNLPIHLAATWHSNDTIIDLLIGYAAFVDSRNRFLQTPMHLAVWEDRPAIVAKLLDKRANPNLRDSAGSTPLLLAAHAGRPELVNLLLAHNADPNIADNAGETPLMLAVKGGYVTVVSALVEKGAKLALLDSNKHSLLYYLEPETAIQMIGVMQDAILQQLAPKDREAAASFFEAGTTDRPAQPNIAQALRNLNK